MHVFAIQIFSFVNFLFKHFVQYFTWLLACVSLSGLFFFLRFDNKPSILYVSCKYILCVACLSFF